MPQSKVNRAHAIQALFGFPGIQVRLQVMADIVSGDCEATLIVYDMDANTWVGLRSINVNERFNREKRRSGDASMIRERAVEIPQSHE